MKKLKSLVYRYGYPVMKAYWFFRRPVTSGVRCVIFCANHILLIKHTYGSPLRTVVGGGIQKDETPKLAVHREVREETGIILDDAIEIGTILHEKAFKKDTIHVFLAKVDSKKLSVTDAEIREACWYPTHELPSDISPLCKKFLALASSFLEQNHMSPG